MLVERFSAAHITAALADTPAVMVNGPRQCGKTTLVRQLASGDRAYLTLDDETVLAAAREDPVGFIRNLDRAVIDEVQHAPELLRAIKRSIDDDRRPGRFLLTGSANVLTMPTVSDSLAGRMEVVTLLPLSHAEISAHRPRFLEAALSGEIVKPRETVLGVALQDFVLTGGYPEMLRRQDPGRRRVWAREYIKAILQRDVRDVAQIDELDRLPRLFAALAHHSGQLTNFAQLGGQLGVDDKTTRKYVGVLEQLFLLRRVEPWSHNRLKRLIKTPKLHFLDSGLLAAVQGTTAERLSKNRARFGPLLETFVFGELAKLATWYEAGCAIHHYRDKDRDEVDFVVEGGDGGVVGVEVKAGATVTARDFRGMHKLAEACQRDFRLGLVLYDGEQVIPFGGRTFAAPVACLWA